MKNIMNAARLGRFYWGLGVFAFSASTVAFVTDPYLIADMSLVIWGIYLMATSFSISSSD